MASLTIRNLDEETKQALRERAAKHGNSMEEEARLILGRLDESNVFQPTGVGNGDAFEAGLFGHGKKIQPRILLIITGGIAAYKCLELIRRLRDRNFDVRVVMSEAAMQFVTPLSVEALAHNRVYSEIFSRDDEHDIGHIRLARNSDLIVVAPATADFLAKMAQGFANDLASTVLLAAKAPILVAPAMNPVMWNNPATIRNVKTLTKDGISFVGPFSGEMAEAGEAGLGRMAEPGQIIEAISAQLEDHPTPLTGRHAIVTAGPTHEPIDPVRYIANRSSGKQGFAIANALAKMGAKVSLVSGPVNLETPSNVNRIDVETAREMNDAVEACLPADIAVMVAAVADWRSKDTKSQKIKKTPGSNDPEVLNLIENPDILKGVASHQLRPRLVIGFAAETEKLIAHAKEKLERKGADWIIANDISAENEVMGGDQNSVKIISGTSIEELPKADKSQIASKIVQKIADYFEVETINT